MGLSTHADSCASSVGVFLSGCAWVGYSLCSVLLLLACTFLVLVLAGLYDFGSVLKATADPNLLVGELRCAAPWNGEYRAAGQMAGATIFFDRDGDGASDGGGLNMCETNPTPTPNPDPSPNSDPNPDPNPNPNQVRHCDRLLP